MNEIIKYDIIKPTNKGGEVNGLNKLFFEAINRVMVQSGHMMKGGTIADATIIDAPSSTKNAEKARNPEMHQTRKGNVWRFGMKCHAGVDAGSGLVHTMTVTSVNKSDIIETVNLIREDGEVVYGDSGYLGVQKCSEIQQNEHFSKVEHVFRIIKCQSGHRKVVYRGLKKNENRLYALFACANLYSLAIAGQKLSTT